MIDLAIRGNIALISCRTTDVLNVPVVLGVLAEAEVALAPSPASGVNIKGALMKSKASVFVAIGDFPVTPDLYGWLGNAGKTMILVNHPEPPPYALDVGTLPVPKECIRDLLNLLVAEDEVDGLMSCFSGLTIKEAGDVAMLTQARDGHLSPRGVLNTRALIASKTTGLQLVNTALDLYLPFKPLEAWLTLNAQFFIAPPDLRLTPRGILLNGPPGTGKSQAAKYVANTFNVPLYRLNMSATLGRYVGQSESAFARILDTVDLEEPCVLLIDEVEKLFQSQSDAGVTERILGHLLWWLQEHRSRVFTVMTTNDLEAIPSELYRDRRIDTTLTIHRLELPEALVLACTVVNLFAPKGQWKRALKAALEELVKGQEDGRASHAQITQLTFDLVKRQGWF